MKLDKTLGAVDKNATETKTYERKFFEKIVLSIIIFAVFALFSAIAVNLILSLDLFAKTTKLDAQTLGNFFIFIFGTSVTFAGAWVVIQIASKQEDLANTQLDLANRQEELAITQLELEKKGLHEYVALQNRSDAVAVGIQSLNQKVNLLFGFYFRVVSSRKKLDNVKVNSESEENFRFILETCLAQSGEILKGITDGLQDAWVLDLISYEKDSKINMSESTGSGLYMLANKLFFEFKKMTTVLEKDSIPDKEIRFSEAFKILRSTHEGVQNFFDTLAQIKATYEKNIESGAINSFNIDSPSIAALIHQKVKRLELKPNFDILE